MTTRVAECMQQLNCPLSVCLTMFQTEGLQGALNKTVQQLREPAVVKRSEFGPGEDPVLRVEVHLAQELAGWTTPSEADYNTQQDEEKEGCGCAIS